MSISSLEIYSYVWAILPRVDSDGIIILRDKELEPTGNEDIALHDPEAEEPEQEAIHEEHLCVIMHFGPHTSLDYDEEVGHYVKTETVAWIRVLTDGRILPQDPLVLKGADYVKKEED